MDTLLIIGSVLAILGIVGSIIPAMPGPVLGFISLILLYFAKPGSISILSIVIFAIVMLLLILIDYLAPLLGAKISGASRKGIFGAVVGALLGIIFFPPLGIFIGSMIGAFLGEIVEGKKPEAAAKAAVGAVLGSFMVMFLQTVYSIIVAIYFFLKAF